MYVLFMNAGDTVKTEQKIPSTAGAPSGPMANRDTFDFYVAGIGDLNGDGVPDALAGAVLDLGGGSFQESSVF